MSEATMTNNRPVRSADLAAAWSARLRRPGEGARRWPLVVGSGTWQNDRAAVHSCSRECRALGPATARAA